MGGTVAHLPKVLGVMADTLKEVFRKRNRRRKPTLAERGISDSRAQTCRSLGVDYEAYLILKESQGSRCAICNELPEKQELSHDHDHETGLPRGLLCSRCNTGLGFFKDDPQRLIHAVLYLRKYGCKVRWPWRMGQSGPAPPPLNTRFRKPRKRLATGGAISM